MLLSYDVLDGLGYFLNLLLLAFGVVLLIFGADFFVRGASSMAKKLKMSSLVIGLTIVSFGTSAPELAISLSSSLKGESGLALGNVVGSNIMNTLCVVGFAAIFSPIVVKKSLCKREFPFLLASTVFLLIFSMDNLFSFYSGIENILSRGECLIFVLGIGLFCYISIVMAKKDALLEIGHADIDKNIQKEEKRLPWWLDVIFFLGGLAGIIFGAEFVTTPATKIATSLGIQANLDKELVTNVVGLTVIAIGTSLPELVTSIVASKKGENDIAIGNAVGSSIFNILFICGLSGVITPLTMTSDIITDAIISLVFIITVFIMSLKGKITRSNGLTLILLYVLYVSYILIRLFYPFIVIPF